MTEFHVVATVLYGPGTEDIVVDAIKSVYDAVDTVLIIDTANREFVHSYGLKTQHAKFSWTGSFGDARTFALDVASKHGDWALTVDTDERVNVGSRAHLQDTLQAADAVDAVVVYASNKARTYKKERLIRLPCAIDWVGPVHEEFNVGKLPHYTANRIFFTELEKTPAQLKTKFERDRIALEHYLQNEPGANKAPRWWYYLGESFAGLERFWEATNAFTRCSSLLGWNEEAAWACYRAAECYLKVGQRQDALEACAIGLTRHSGIAELAWLASWICLDLGRDDQAVYWARMATMHGLFVGDGAAIRRLHFRHEPALWEGPYAVLRAAETHRGNKEAAEEYDRLWWAAKAKREAL